MTNNAREISKLLMGYVPLFPHCKLEAGNVAMMAMALDELTVEQVGAAMQQLLKKSKFYPTVADIYDQVEKMNLAISERMGTGGQLTAAQAWEEVIRNAKSINYLYHDWEFSTPEVERTAKQFGIAELATLESDAVNTARAQFMRMYEATLCKAKRQQETDSLLQRIGSERAQLLIGQALKSKDNDVAMIGITG